MKRVLALAVVLAIAASVSAADVPQRRAQTLRESPRAIVSPLILEARKALFESSQLERARQLAQEEVADDPGSAEALFIEMETAALQADTAVELNAALALCESRAAWQRDPRAAIAAARVLDLAANTEEFRPAIARIDGMLARHLRRAQHPYASYLRAALVAAATDGARGINLEKVARESGLMTGWRVAGPFGHYPNLEFDQHWSPEHDGLLPAASEGHPVERLHFSDGTFRLPSYFSRAGVLYAAGETTTSARDIMVRAESRGTLEILVDGDVVLRKDDRFHVTPEIAWRTLRLAPGAHEVVVKFLGSASPFRVALVPAPLVQAARPPEIDYAPEAAYVAAAQKYWAGDYNGAVADLESSARQSAAADFLLYHAWVHVADDSPEATATLNAVLQAAPSAMAAEYELAARAFAAERTDEALARLQRVVAARDHFLPAQDLLAQIAIRLNWTVLGEHALDMQLRVHPSCDVLLRGYKFFAGHARYERSRELRRELADCAPDTLSYERTLIQSGDHDQAIAALQGTIDKRPLDRAARELLIHELALTGRADQARAAAEDLAALAPNSMAYRQTAQVAATNPAALLDAGQLDEGLAPGDAFYAKYRRDGVEMVRSTNDRKFSGGPAVMLLNDRVVQLGDDGRVSVYVHRITRVLDRDGIEKYGEAWIPRGARILELRTINADLSVAEPELTPLKATVSMPALTAGDAIDEEYVVNYPGGGLMEHAAEFRHSFGSFAAPILYSRFTVITPAAVPVRSDVAPAVAPAHVETSGGTRVLSWEKNDIPQSVEEVATARGDVLPAVSLEADSPAAGTDVRDRVRDQLVDAVRIGPRVDRLAAQFHARDSQEKAREIFRAIATSVRSAGAFDVSHMIGAEDTLAARSGSRTIAVLAVARAAGLDADLVLARNAGTVLLDNRVSLGLYARPLIRFRFADGREVYADAETEGLAFGALPPSIERHDALLVPGLRENAPVLLASAPAMLSLPANAEEQSIAEGDITLERDGSLKAQVTIRMGAWRSAQMRSILAGIEPGQRARFYQQLAARIFSGADGVTGSARNERDPDRPLEIVLHCRASRYVDLAHRAADIDQLVPTLGLKRMYGGAVRKFPLFIDTPLVESATFHVHLPAGVGVAGMTPALNVNTAFGSYSLTLHQSAPAVLDVQRTFHIPAQVVTPERFPEFSAFASLIDDAERQRITLQKN